MKGRLVVLLAMAILLLIVVLSAQNQMVATALFAFVLVLFLYVIILSWLGLRRKMALIAAARQAGTPTLPDPLPFISIIVPCKNEARAIAGTIANLRKLVYGDPKAPAYELLVVDDGSTDGTYSVISKIAADDPAVHAVHRAPGSHPGKSAVLNDALTHCRGEYIAVFDADARVAADFLQRALIHFCAPKLAAVQAEKRTINAYRNFDINDLASTVAQPRLWTLPFYQEVELMADSISQVARELQHGITELRGNGELFRREALESIGGWNNETLTDDLDTSTRLHMSGWDIHYAPEIKVWEEGVVRGQAIWRQRRRWAEGSIRRHLDFTLTLLAAPIPLQKKIDDIVFVTEFAVTPWMTLSVLVAIIQFLLTRDVNLFPVFVASSSILLTVPPAVAGMMSEMKLNPVVIIATIPPFILFLLHWPLVVTYTLAMIILRSRRLVWAKTEHAGHA